MKPVRGILCCLLCFVTSLLATPLLAQQAASQPISLDAKQSAELIREVLQQPDFGEEKLKTHWRFRGAEDQPQKDVPEWLKNFFDWLLKQNANATSENPFNLGLMLEILMWLLLFGAIFYLWKKLSPVISAWRQKNGKSLKTSRGKAQVMLVSQRMALDTLPPDIPAQVQALAQQGQYREALSLLYRGALQALVNNDEVEIPASATEADCHAIIAARRPPDEAEFFDQLTTRWLRTAYAHVEPAQQDILALIQQWRAFYQGTKA